MSNTHHIIAVKRSQTKYGDPMWICDTQEGDTLFIFTREKGTPYAPLDKMWIQAGYDDLFYAMPMNETDVWETHPITVSAAKNGQYWNIVSVDKRLSFAKPDVFEAPSSDLFKSQIESQLRFLTTSNVSIFDTETTGTNPYKDEIVSFACVDWDGNRIVDDNGGLHFEWQNLYIQPENTGKLLAKDKDGVCAYDIHGIHPDFLEEYGSFPETYDTLHNVLMDSHWICWNADFDVTLLDNLCIRHQLPLIPRLSVTCAMKLLSPLVGSWDTKRGQFTWAKLEDAANQYGIDTDKAHDAYADVCMTRDVMQAVLKGLDS